MQTSRAFSFTPPLPISSLRCKNMDVPLEKIYNKTQRDKFAWAVDMTEADFEFWRPFCVSSDHIFHARYTVSSFIAFLFIFKHFHQYFIVWKYSFKFLIKSVIEAINIVSIGCLNYSDLKAYLSLSETMYSKIFTTLQIWPYYFKIFTLQCRISMVHKIVIYIFFLINFPSTDYLLLL